MIERYSRKEKKVFKDYNRYSIWLDIELVKRSNGKIKDYT